MHKTQILTVIVIVLAAIAPARSAVSSVMLFPELFEMNQSLKEATPRIEAACSRTDRYDYTGAMAAPFQHQIQIDCFGLPIMGKPRKVEFMFNEGNLEFLWVLLDKEELDAVEETLREVFGDVVFANNNDKIFADGTIALRSEPAEILIGTPELVSDITGFKH